MNHERAYLEHQLTLLIVQAGVSNHRLPELLLHLLQLLFHIPHILVKPVLRAVGRAPTGIVAPRVAGPSRHTSHTIWERKIELLRLNINISRLSGL